MEAQSCSESLRGNPLRCLHRCNMEACCHDNVLVSMTHILSTCTTAGTSWLATQVVLILIWLAWNLAS